MRTIDELDVAGRRVLVRADLNVPLDRSGPAPRITDDGRVRATEPTVRELTVLRRVTGPPGAAGTAGASGAAGTTGADRPYLVVLGGSKVSDKLGVIRALLPSVDALLVGGGMCFTFLAAQGHGIGDSLLE